MFRSLFEHRFDDGGEQKTVENDDERLNNLANEVILGKHGNGKARKDKLGDDYEAVQKIVNELYKKEDEEAAKVKDTVEKVSVDDLVKDVIAGKYKNGYQRRKRLGSRYDEVQKAVNAKLSEKKTGGKKEENVETTTKAEDSVLDGQTNTNELGPDEYGSFAPSDYTSAKSDTTQQASTEKKAAALDSSKFENLSDAQITSYIKQLYDVVKSRKNGGKSGDTDEFDKLMDALNSSK